MIRAAIGTPTQDRLLKVGQALRMGLSHEEIHQFCKIDPWFIEQLQGIVDLERKVRKHGLPQTPGAFRELKAAGFSDARLAALAGKSEAEVRTLRRSLDVRPVYKRIDTCAAEFSTPTAYMYSTYQPPFAGQPASEALPSTARR